MIKQNYIFFPLLQGSFLWCLSALIPLAISNRKCTLQNIPWLWSGNGGSAVHNGVRSAFTQSIDSISCNLFVLSVPLLGVYFSSDEQTIKISQFASGKLQVVSRDEKKQACKQCLCNFFSSSGKICAKFYGFLSQKWEMLQVCAFIVICLAFCNYDGNLWYLLELLWDFMALFGTFGLLHCFVES